MKVKLGTWLKLKGLKQVDLSVGNLAQFNLYCNGRMGLPKKYHSELSGKLKVPVEWVIKNEYTITQKDLPQ